MPNVSSKAGGLEATAGHLISRSPRHIDDSVPAWHGMQGHLSG